MQKYKIDFLTFTTDSQVKSDCADITFYNNGGTNIILNNSVLITPGNSLSLTANFNEIDLTIYQFYFIPNGVRVNKLVVFRKIYV
jgi:hypothetical protein